MLVNARFGDFEHYFQNFQVSDSWMVLAIPVLVFFPSIIFTGKFIGLSGLQHMKPDWY